VPTSIESSVTDIGTHLRAAAAAIVDRCRHPRPVMAGTQTG
jgi:hypothetical protein